MIPRGFWHGVLQGYDSKWFAVRARTGWILAGRNAGPVSVRRTAIAIAEPWTTDSQGTAHSQECLPPQFARGRRELGAPVLCHLQAAPTARAQGASGRISSMFYFTARVKRSRRMSWQGRRGYKRPLFFGVESETVPIAQRLGIVLVSGCADVIFLCLFR
jgi:hypothetical protein